jgi:hypothetical protein
MAPVIRGSSLYKIVAGKTWFDAEDASIALGGHLVTINDDSENAWLHNTFNIHTNHMPERTFDLELYWTGYTDQESEGDWRWASDEISSYTNWYSDEPNGGVNENYVHLGWHSPQWNDAQSGVDDDLLQSITIGGIAEIPLTSTIIFSATPKEGAGVFTTSINLSAGTSESGNLAEGATVYWKITGIETEDLASGQLSGSGTISNGKLDLQHSLKRDSDTGESFEIAVYSDTEMTQQIGSTVSGSVLEGPKVVARGNSLYVVVDGPSWTEALVNAQSLGGTLAVIEDEAENTFLTASHKRDQLLFVDGALYDDYVAWIGLTYDFETEEWRNTDGQPQTYFNWNPSFLDAKDPIYGQVNTSIILSSTSPYVAEDGVWDDSSENQDVPYLRNGIAEIPFIQRGDSAYVIVQGPTWEEAEANAQALGGHLVTINDADENDWILENLDFAEQAWIGLDFDISTNQWSWASGDNSEFRAPRKLSFSAGVERH